MDISLETIEVIYKHLDTGAQANTASEDSAKMWERNHNTQGKADLNCEYIIFN